MQIRRRRQGPLSGWQGSLEKTTDTFSIVDFLKTDGPTNATEVADLRCAVAEGGTFGNFRGIVGQDSDRPNLFVYGPNSILFPHKEDRPKLIKAIDDLELAEAPL